MELKFIHNDMGEFMPNKAKIFFSCHLEDMKYFDEISKEILDLSYCFFYYVEDEKDFDEKEWEFSLKEMSLLVVPITKKYLTTPNRAFDIDIKIARENNIPILPIMCEDDIVSLFNERFGEYQFLSKVSTDSTEVSYKDKLSDFLSSIIHSQEKTSLIMRNFKGLVFLSYRKKDRAIAQQLIREIHNTEELYDLCIWYDEFLTPGEDFNNEIELLLQHSDLMILNVTPSIVEDGNYIIHVEYPSALALNKQVLPIEMVNTDREQLAKNYDGLPTLVGVDNKQFIIKQIKQSLGSKFNSFKKQNKLEHKYYVALGYIDGLGVSKDKELGVRLLSECADEGYAPAIYDLSTMYIFGKCVKQDVKKGITLRKILIDKALNLAKSKKIKDKIIGISNYLSEIKDVAPIYYLISKSELINELTATADILIQEIEDYKIKKPLPKKLDMLHNVNKMKYYSSLGVRYFVNCDYKKALDYLLKVNECNKLRVLEMWKEINGNVPVDQRKIDVMNALETFDNIGVCYLNLEDYENAEKYLIGCLDALKEILSINQMDETDEFRVFMHRYGLVLAYLGILYTKTQNNKKAIDCFKQAISNQEILGKMYDSNYEDALISYMSQLANVYIQANMLKDAEFELTKANAILERKLLAKDKSLYKVQIGLYNEVMGNLCVALNKSDHAISCYQKSVISFAKLNNNKKLEELENKIKACKKEK